MIRCRMIGKNTAFLAFAVVGGGQITLAELREAVRELANSNPFPPKEIPKLQQHELTFTLVREMISTPVMSDAREEWPPLPRARSPHEWRMGHALASYREKIRAFTRGNFQKGRW